MIDLRDTRILEKQADEYIKRNDLLIFRLLLQNGNMVERLVKPIKPNRNIPPIYRDVRRVYAPKKGEIKDIKNVNVRSLRRLESEEMPSKPGEGNTVKSLIVALLEMGFIEVRGG